MKKVLRVVLAVLVGSLFAVTPVVAETTTLRISLSEGKKAPRVFIYYKDKCSSKNGQFVCKSGAKKPWPFTKEGNVLVYTTSDPGWGFCTFSKVVNCYEPGGGTFSISKW